MKETIEKKISQYQEELDKITKEIERLNEIKLRIEGGIIAAREILGELDNEENQISEIEENDV